MTNKNLTRLAFVVDRSGSMVTIQNDMEGAIRATLASQAALDGELRVDITIFDTSVDVLYNNVLVDEITNEPIIHPRGGTALNDALGSTIVRLGEELANLPEEERPGFVILAIVTDGEENSSREYTKEAVKELVERQRDEFQWEILFLGAESIDAFAASSGYGIGRGQTISFGTTTDAVFAASASVSAYATRTRSGLATVFTDKEREAAKPTGPSASVKLGDGEWITAD